ncbi:hypothetical protein Lesp02_66230 [Lentzea sp. NBRC 105346]|nr:hypothetical protein Lesp02_66230 [Lentzea sp. NBRC 105346]
MNAASLVSSACAELIIEAVTAAVASRVTTARLLAALRMTAELLSMQGWCGARYFRYGTLRKPFTF